MARAAAEESDNIFTDLIRLIELKRFEVRELIKVQEKTAAGEAEQLLEKIQKEIDELRKNEAELDLLSHTEDPVQFLQVTLLTLFASDYSDSAALILTPSPLLMCVQRCHSVHAPPALSSPPLLNANPSLSFDPVMTAVSDFKGLLHEVCQGGFVSIYEKG